MLITEILSRNARMYRDEIALVERVPAEGRRSEITWKEFDGISHRVSNALAAKNVVKGTMVVHLMMNCLEWLPIYFGILRTGAVAVPLNFRFRAKTIADCIKVSEAPVIFFGEEFINRINSITHEIGIFIKTYIFVGPKEKCPEYAIWYSDFISGASDVPLRSDISILDDAGLYFTSGTTGDPKAALLTHRNLEFSCHVENRHHRQTHEDNFLCIPPLYHTGAKMHWFGNFIVGRPGGYSEGGRTAVDNRGRIRGKGDHRMAAGALGTGHPTGHRERGHQTEQIHPRPMAPDAYRRPTGAEKPGE